MTPIQKRLEKLEQEMKYLKQTADKAVLFNDSIMTLFDWLDVNLTEEQKKQLGQSMGVEVNE